MCSNINTNSKQKCTSKSLETHTHTPTRNCDLEFLCRIAFWKWMCILLLKDLLVPRDRSWEPSAKRASRKGRPRYGAGPCSSNAVVRWMFMCAAFSILSGVKSAKCLNTRHKHLTPAQNVRVISPLRSRNGEQAYYPRMKRSCVQHVAIAEWWTRIWLPH